MMKHHHLTLCLLLMVVCLLTAPVAAVNITGATVENTNVYAGSSLYDIAPAGEYESSTATGITYVSGRYLYASGLSNTNAAGIATYTISGIQGSTTTVADLGTSQGYSWNYGDGTTAQTTSLTHRYSAPGSYITTLSLSNYLSESPVTLQTTVSIASFGAYNCSVENTNVYAKSERYDITPPANNKEGNTATGITNTAGQTLGFSWSPTVAGNTVSYTANIIGSTTTAADIGTTQIKAIDYGDGTTAQNPVATVSHTYTAGIYSPGYTVGNYLTPEKTYYLAPIAIGIGTYTPDSIAQTSPDIVTDAGSLYTVETRFLLPNETAALEMEFFADNKLIVAAGNAVYSVDTGAEEIQPVTDVTADILDSVYIGEYAAVVIDQNGNAAAYNYAENTFSYLETNPDHIAATQNYLMVIKNSVATIYTTSPIIKSTTTTAPNLEALAGCDIANTFAGYNGSTVYYWYQQGGEWLQNNATIEHEITGITQIPQTSDYIITTEANTYVISITAAGEYSVILISETELPITHPQATTIGVIIGVHPPNNAYIIGADGSTTGVYQTGATLADASITKATGLYAVTGGTDQQAYYLRKDTESQWSLAQIVKVNAAITKTQISTTGGYSAIISGTNMYLLKISDTPDSTIYLQAIVIDSVGQPYKGALTINGEEVITDSNGKFSYPVTPGNLYKIIVGTTIVEYSATNAALQQIAIKLKVSPLQTEIEYSAEYNQQTGTIDMVYFDTKYETTAVSWEVRETVNNTVVATYTGNSASYTVPPENAYTNYYIKLTADRGNIDVTQSWSITPAGGKPVDLFGMDETGKNIIFGFLLIILAGLFGVMHSKSGAILLAFTACVLRYLELVTIPWVIILVAAVLAIVAAIAGGGRE